MGSKPSKHSSKERLQAEVEAVSSNDDSSNQGSSSIINLIKPDCLKTKKKINRKKRLLQPPEEKKITKARKLTLEDWLLASPGPSLSPDSLNGGELYVFKQFSKRVHPSPARMNENEPIIPSTPRESDSMDISLLSAASSMSRTQSVKLKKKVSFRLPEEADIIIFYSPEETFGP